MGLLEDLGALLKKGTDALNITERPQVQLQPDILQTDPGLPQQVASASRSMGSRLYNPVRPEMSTVEPMELDKDTIARTTPRMYQTLEDLIKRAPDYRLDDDGLTFRNTLKYSGLQEVAGKNNKQWTSGTGEHDPSIANEYKQKLTEAYNMITGNDTDNWCNEAYCGAHQTAMLAETNHPLAKIGSMLGGGAIQNAKRNPKEYQVTDRPTEGINSVAVPSTGASSGYHAKLSYTNKNYPNEIGWSDGNSTLPNSMRNKKHAEDGVKTVFEKKQKNYGGAKFASAKSKDDIRKQQVAEIVNKKRT